MILIVENLTSVKLLCQQKKSILQFKNFKNKEKVPFIIYADFERLLKPVNDDDDQWMFQEHQAYSVGYNMKSSYAEAESKYASYRQLNKEMMTPAQWFIEEWREIANALEQGIKIQNL